MPGSVCLCKVRTPMQDAGLNARCCVASVVESFVSLFNGSKCNRVTFSVHITEMRRCYISGHNVAMLHV